MRTARSTLIPSSVTYDADANVTFGTNTAPAMAAATVMRAASDVPLRVNARGVE